MTTTTMSAIQGQSAQPGLQGPSQRLRRAIFIAGNVGLMLGALVGLLRVQPGLLAASVPFSVPASAIPLVGMAATGLFVGATSGLALRGSKGMLRFSAAMFVVMASLLATEIVRSIGLHISFRDALLNENPAVMAEQIGLGALGALLGTQTGRVRVRPTGAVQGRSADRSQRVSERRRARGRARNARTAAASAPSQGVQIGKPAPQKPIYKRRRWVRPGVHLGREKTSVCPYCLEEVKPRDPRGRVVCKICGTPHHADCWAITGKCEVPHLQT